MQYNPAMFAPALILPALNRLLDTQPSARARLARHAGKQVRMRLPFFGLGFRFDTDGRFAPSDPALAESTSIHVSPDLLPGLLFDARATLARARVDGDGTLAHDLAIALEGFDWALALRPYVGDIVAARAVRGFAGLVTWRAQAGASLGRALSEYATYESGMLADPASVRAFIAEVDATRDAAARLEARLRRLEARVPTAGAGPEG
jgi:ubiquinone biosynthesis protein UbiJ